MNHKMMKSFFFFSENRLFCRALRWNPAEIPVPLSFYWFVCLWVVASSLLMMAATIPLPTILRSRMLVVGLVASAVGFEMEQLTRRTEVAATMADGGTVAESTEAVGVGYKVSPVVRGVFSF
ncbi:hypothetical protein ACH5RR_041838 [Cinchona calisaya]|uniref:Uncharacterized protein n=1 Tax=Cinchona calisaya TaxID=153742 RepID=A0ABD2XX78_9GENT